MQVIQWKPIPVILAVTLGVILLITLKVFNRIPSHSSSVNELKSSNSRTFSNGATAVPSGHKLAVIVPFRDRFEELMEFVPHLHSFLVNASVPHRILVINQADKLRFNRASLINIGHRLSSKDCDYLVMHDVDLLPVNPALNYHFPDGYVYHLAAPHLHPLYHYKTFVGGILMITHRDFKVLNGLSNRYWGWGREDDEFYVRMKEAKLEIRRPSPEEIDTGYNTFRHIHDRIKRPRDNKRYGDQKKSGSRRDRKTGLNTVQYKLTETYEVTIKGAPATIYNVELYCDYNDTPWCENPSS